MALLSSFRPHGLLSYAACGAALALYAGVAPSAVAAALVGDGPSAHRTAAVADSAGVRAPTWPRPARPGGGPVPFDVGLAPDADAAGASGALRVRIVMPGEQLEVPLDWGAVRPGDAWYQWLPTHGSTALVAAERPLHAGEPIYAPNSAGTWTLAVGWDGGGRVLNELVLLVRAPAAAQRDGRLNGYRIGSYPGGSGRYAPPAGFIEVTRENQELYVSRNLQLKHFLTKDQFDAWPKYVLVDPLLLDKLELVLTELRAEGIRADRIFVMSGYRTPQYNAQGLDQGRAALSRHQYGDAADVWIENDDRPGYMADLNDDGRVDEHDARVMLRAMERVEARHPELLGGGGVYRANAAHGPFLHIDVRGTRSRW